VEGIRTVESVSEDGRSAITIEFNIDRDIDGAANDIRDRVSAVLDQLPVEAEPPKIQKVDSNEDVIMWLNLVSDRMSVPELTDYARRYLVDRFSVIDGVARIQVGGSQVYAMRVWLDRNELAARRLDGGGCRGRTASREPGAAGRRHRVGRSAVQRAHEAAPSTTRRISPVWSCAGHDGYLVRLGDVARVERGTEENRTFFRGNGVPMVGIGVVKQSTANTVAVADAAKAEAARINATLPEGMEIKQSFDSSIFVKDAIKEVYKTLAIAIGLVILIIFLFLGSVRAMLVPAVTVPVSIVATFTVLLALGFSVNILTLLALVLAIGLVVDDAIVVLENIHRRMEQYGETRLVAAYRGTRQVAFAVVATTIVLISVFVPIAFLQGDVGRLFAEFALTMAAAVAFSSFVALSLSPMLASQILPQSHRRASLTHGVDWVFQWVRRGYGRLLRFLLRQPWIVGAGLHRDARRSRLAVRADPAGICAERGSRCLFCPGQRPRGRIVWIHEQIHGRDRATAHALRRIRRGDPAARARASYLLQYRALQHRHRRDGSERLRQTPFGLGHHGRGAGEARRSARRDRLSRSCVRDSARASRSRFSS
jgi:multidrug efflux pump